MEEPEIEPRNRVVIARITEVQKAEKLFIDKEKPKKSVVLPRAAMKAEIEVGRVAQRGQAVPRRGDQENNQSAAERMKPLPRSRTKELAREQKIDDTCGERKKHSNQTL